MVSRPLPFPGNPYPIEWDVYTLLWVGGIFIVVVVTIVISCLLTSCEFFSSGFESEEKDTEVDVAGDGDTADLLYGMVSTSKHSEAQCFN